jgi:RNA-directed DNA polymerase
VSPPLVAKPSIRRVDVRSGDGGGTKFCALTQGDLSASAPRGGSRRELKDEMAKGREESDGRKGPQARRKSGVTARQRGGKATTASEQVRQLRLFSETADSPRGDDGVADTGLPVPATRAVPKSGNARGNALPVMTMEEVANEGNLRRAFRKVASNDGAPGPDRQSVEEVEAHLDEVLPALSRALLEGSYRPGMIRRVWIPKPGGGERGLGIPNVVDRLVQQAVHQVLSPNYEPTFHGSSHGFRPGRSCHTAIAEARCYLEEGYEWVVDLDLEKFFDRVNHERLVARLEQRVKDSRLIQLIRQMLKAKVVMPDGVVVSTEEGTPQGGPLSPLLSNIVLDELDQELERRGHRFVRYADDGNVYVRSERSGKRVMASVVRFIEGRLRLKVNLAKSAVARPEERHFLGFRLRREPTDGTVEVLLSPRSKERIDEKIRVLTPRTWGRSLKDCILGLNAYLRGWIGFFWICSAAEERTLHGLDAHIRRRLRALLLKQWKRKRFIVRRLIKLGVNPKTAWRGIYKGRQSLWALSHSTPVDRGLRNAYFAKRGLESLESRWKELHGRARIASAQLALGLG